MRKIYLIKKFPITIIISIIIISMVLFMKNDHINIKNYLLLEIAITLLVINILIIFVLFFCNSIRYRVYLDSKKNLSVFDDYYKNFERFFQSYLKKYNFRVKKIPLYLLIGKKDVGKTSFLQNCSLSFIKKNFLAKKIHDEYAQNWQICSDALMVELPLAGDYDFEDIELKKNNRPNVLSYEFFIKALKKYNRIRLFKRNINGVIFVLDLPDILGQTNLLNFQDQEKLRSSTDYIFQNIKRLTPVYLLLTKLDQLVGFSEYFSDLSKDEKEQPFGIAFPEIKGDKQLLIDYFNVEFDRLVAVINQRLLLRISREKSIYNRFQIFDFPLQLQLCKNVISEYILKNESIIIRGIYFVSTNNENEVRDYVINHSKNTSQVKYADNCVENKHNILFSSKIFKNVILSDIDYVSNANENRKNKLIKICYKIIFPILILIAIIGLGYSYKYNKLKLHRIEMSIPIVQKKIELLFSNNFDLSSKINLLNIFGDINEIYKIKISNFYDFLEILSPIYIREEINYLWSTVLQKLIIDSSFQQIEDHLKNDHESDENLIEYLKAYLAFAKDFNIERSSMKIPVLYLLHKNTENKQDDIERFEYYMDNILYYPISYKELDNSLLSNIRQRLSKLNPVNFVYNEMKKYSEITNYSFKTDEIINKDLNKVFDFIGNDFSIPFLYTIDGYRYLLKLNQNDIVNFMPILSFIWGFSNDHFQNIMSMIFQNLFVIYANDYTKCWLDFLSNIKIRQFHNIRQAIEILDLLTKENSPFDEFLMAMKDNTLLKDNNLDISSQFRDINNIILGKNINSKNDYLSIKNLLLDLKKYFISLDKSPNSKQNEFEDLKNMFDKKLSNHPIIMLDEFAKKMPNPLNRWLEEIVDSSMNILLEGAHEVIAEAWKKEVIPYYNSTIRGKFPFGDDFNNTVTLANFGNFFGEKGIFSQFYQTYLSAFLVKSNATIRQRNFGKYLIGFDRLMLENTRLAFSISNKYFLNNNNQPAINFLIRPHYLDPESSGFYLQVANSSINYRHDPAQITDLHWPFVGDSQQVGYLFNDFQNKSFNKTFDGPWAFFKFLKSTELKYSEISGHYMFVVSMNDHKAIFDLWDENTRQIFDFQEFRDFLLPDII